MIREPFAPVHASAPPTLAQHRVLLVDEDPAERALLAASLRALGVGQVDVAACGNTALALIAEAADGYDAVLCELHMSQSRAMDGIEFIRSARGARVGVLILLSALDEALFAWTDRLARAHGWTSIARLARPVDLARLQMLLVANRLAPRAASPALAPFTRVWSAADVRQALARREFVSYFQPKVDLVSGAVVGVEALARWAHPEAGLLPPSAFVPLMEREGLIGELTEQLYRRVLGAVANWRAAGLTMPVALNASALTLEHVDLPQRWRAIAAEHGVDPAMLTVELTETALARRFNGLLESLTRLRMHGFGVALDDFGTGYASVQQLCDMPFTEIKIDRRFVADTADSARANAVLHALVGLCKALDMRVVAEGIETARQAQAVLAAGCGVGQGYYFGHALAPADLPARAANNPHPLSVY